MSTLGLELTLMRTHDLWNSCAWSIYACQRAVNEWEIAANERTVPLPWALVGYSSVGTSRSSPCFQPSAGSTSWFNTSAQKEHRRRLQEGARASRRGGEQVGNREGVDLRTEVVDGTQRRLLHSVTSHGLPAKTRPLAIDHHHLLPKS